MSPRAARYRGVAFFFAVLMSSVGHVEAARADRAPRQPAVLAAPAISAQHAQDRAKAFAGLADWARSEGISIAAHSMIGSRATQILVRYGQHLYDANRPIGIFRLVLLAVQDRFSDLEPYMRLPWRAVSKWQILEPSTPHVPITRELWKAMIAIALLLGRPAFAMMLVIGFACAMRPGELLGLVRGHVILPCDIADTRPVGFISLPQHKTARFGQAHVAIRDRFVLEFLTAMTHGLDVNDSLYPASAYAFRRLWDYICDLLHVPHVDGQGYTPSSLRAGGVTDLYMAGTPIAEIRWVLRHRTEGSTWRYVQEAGAALRFARLPSLARARIGLFAPHASALMQLAMRKKSTVPLQSSR